MIDKVTRVCIIADSKPNNHNRDTKMPKKYYAVQFTPGVNTTTGTPNTTTGHMSIAHDLMVFSSKEKRDGWVENGKVTSDMRGNCRRSVTKKEARNLNLGICVADFEQHLEMMLDVDDN